MIYPEGLMHRKVNIGLALIVIFVVAGVFAAIISAKALVQPSFGGRVFAVSPCILDTPANAPTTCGISCPLCTSLMGPACASAYQITFIPSRGSSYNFICPSKAYPFRRGYLPTPGSFILGNGLQISPLQVW